LLKLKAKLPAGFFKPSCFGIRAGSGKSAAAKSDMFQYSSLWHPLSVARVTNRTDVIVDGNDAPLVASLMEVRASRAPGVWVRFVRAGL
jgi:hypothetical protein